MFIHVCCFTIADEKEVIGPETHLPNSLTTVLIQSRRKRNTKIQFIHMTRVRQGDNYKDLDVR